MKNKHQWFIPGRKELLKEQAKKSKDWLKGFYESLNRIHENQKSKESEWFQDDHIDNNINRSVKY